MLHVTTDSVKNVPAIFIYLMYFVASNLAVSRLISDSFVTV